MAAVVHLTIKEERESIEKVPRRLLVGECFVLIRHDEIEGVLHLMTMDKKRKFYAAVSPLEELP
jgi:hypothetical protein